MPLETLSDAEITAGLAGLPSWTYADGVLQRRIRTQSFKGSLMVATTVGHLCEVAWHHPELVVTFNTVTVKLWTHSAGAITARDLAVAAKIEDLLSWNPAGDDGALSGTPRDPRHAYLLTDDPPQPSS